MLFRQHQRRNRLLQGIQDPHILVLFTEINLYACKFTQSL
jgi:hypothetical protein